MKQLGRLKLTQVNSNKLQKKDLGSLKGGAFCTSYNCSCSGTTFTSGLSDAVLEDDSHR